ncbi:DUF6694 family lipoprotein [Pseudomonas sp. Leaf59]|uniref:DUF6694 family lipoprotein n=1 Tax=Pseudomonas sp. Leaf59 TaxID=2876556 RepID=UPI001E5F83D2|nr:DUF6694 family lipoprotein [Pseudomonas sp. Leaf59]
MKRIVLLGAIATLLVGCGDKKIDGATEDSFKKSMSAVSESLPADKRDQFKQDVILLSMKGIDLASVMSGKQTSQSVFDTARQDMDGKTAAQIMDQASAVRLERERREKDQALAEIQELISKKNKAESAKAQLQAFTVGKSRFYLESQKYISQKKPFIELSVKNGTAQAVSRAYFKGTIASPGRSIPWFSDVFNYEIPGGLEPGETADWVLGPNPYSDWGKVDAPADAVFTVEVYRLDGANKTALYSSEGLTESNQKRLEALQKKYSVN